MIAVDERVLLIRDTLAGVLIRDRGNRCAYCHLPTKRSFHTQNGAKLRACSNACEAAVKARIEGYDEKRIAFAWNACSEDERRPNQNVLIESGERPIARAEASEARHGEECGTEVFHIEATSQSGSVS